MLKRPPLARMHARKHLRHSSSSWRRIDELKQRPRKVWPGVGQSVIDGAMY